MRKFMITGALAGFILGGSLAVSQGASGGELFWRAAVSAAVLAVLMRWWWQTWRRSIHEAQQKRIQAMTEAMSKLPGEAERVVN
ncbi:MAG: hypothetical protein RIT19_2413 [Verrucomicrobiota bacterium]|jgi:hypothetical protein